MLMPPALYSSDKKAAEEYLKTTKYPFVSKAIEGAHASNVRLVENEHRKPEKNSKQYSLKKEKHATMLISLV